MVLEQTTSLPTTLSQAQIHRHTLKLFSMSSAPAFEWTAIKNSLVWPRGLARGTSQPHCLLQQVLLHTKGFNDYFAQHSISKSAFTLLRVVRLPLGTEIKQLRTEQGKEWERELLDPYWNRTGRAKRMKGTLVTLIKVD